LKLLWQLRRPTVLTFKNFAFCPQFPTILRTNKDYFLRQDQSVVLCMGDRVLCVEGTNFPVLYKTNFMLRALCLRLAGLGQFTTIPKTGRYSDMLKTGNQILCLYRLIIQINAFPTKNMLNKYNNERSLVPPRVNRFTHTPVTFAFITIKTSILPLPFSIFKPRLLNLQSSL